MVAYSFQTQFAGDVASGRKRQTIRAQRKRHARVGEPVQLYVGMRTKGCRKLVEPDPVCSAVDEVCLYLKGRRCKPAIAVNGQDLPRTEVAAMAAADGFESPLQMFQWFAQTHGLPFIGVLVRWEAGQAMAS